MKTDLEVITGTIVEILRSGPPFSHSGWGHTAWEQDRRKSLEALYTKLEAAPFYSVHEVYDNQDSALAPGEGREDV